MHQSAGVFWFIIVEVEDYVEEHRNLGKDAWAPFPSGQGFQLASWFLETSAKIVPWVLMRPVCPVRRRLQALIT